MNKFANLTIGLTLGLAIGAGAVWSFTQYSVQDTDHATQPKRTVADASTSDLVKKLEAGLDVDATQQDQVDQLHFTTLEEILTLSSDFKQTEMLYTLAGSASPRELIELIKQAESVGDSSDRNAALSILFSRLTDLNPKLALELAEDPLFSSDESVYSSVWRSWARSDFDAAIAHLSAVAPYVKKQRAARAMYWAVDVFGNNKADQIQQVSGIEPTNWAVAQKIEKVARGSIAQALSLVNGLSSVTKQQYAVKGVAEVAVNTEADAALSYANLLISPAVKKSYRDNVLRTLGTQAPLVTLENWAADNYAKENLQAVYAAFPQLAQSDFLMAQSIAEASPASPQKTWMMKTLVGLKIKENATEGLLLAQQYDQAVGSGVTQYAASQLISIDPVAAIQALESVDSLVNKRDLLAKAIGALSRVDLQVARGKIDSLSDPELKSAAQTAFFTEWSKTDVNGALRYALESPSLDLNDLTTYSIQLAGADVDLTMRFLSRLSGDQASSMVHNFAFSLSQQYGVNEIVAKLRPYGSEPSFKSIRSTLLQQIARTNPLESDQLIEAFWGVNEKGRAYLSIAESVAYDNPDQAFALFDKLDTERDKLTFAQTILAYGKNVAKAKRWIGDLPEGNIRDQAILSLAYRLNPSSKQDQRLIQSVSRPQLLDNAIANFLSRQYGNDMEKFIKRAEDLGMSEQTLNATRQQYQCMQEYDTGKQVSEKCRGFNGGFGL